MLKPISRAKDRDVGPPFEALWRSLLGRGPFLKLAALRKTARLPHQAKDRADMLAQVTAGDRRWTLLVAERRLGQPREVRTAGSHLEMRACWFRPRRCADFD